MRYQQFYMMPIVVAMMFGVIGEAYSQTQCSAGSGCATTQGRARPGTGQAVPTQPSSDPFRNPLQQPLPPAASTANPQQTAPQTFPPPPR